MRWVVYVACMGERRGLYMVLVRKPEGKRPLGIPRHRWEDNI
jgi:S-ribosylhomocysteine lyase LuxS involved in autoinducer biosynthesis